MNVDVIYGSALWYSATKVNCHFVAERLAREVPVLYVESVGARMPGTHEWLRILPRLLRSLRPLRRIGDRLWVFSPLPVPAYRGRGARLNSRGVGWQVRLLLALRRWHAPVTWVFHPMGWGVRRLSRRGKLVYYCVDDYAANPGVDVATLRGFEEQLARIADVTLVTGEPLARRLRPWADDVRILPNVADTTLFARDHSGVTHPVLAALDKIPRPRLGYLGNLAAYKLDLGLVRAVAECCPEWSVVLVGPRDQGDTRRRVGGVSLPPNVHILDPVPHGLAPAVIDRFDVGLLPSAAHPVMQASFPLKFFEYLLRARPVVSRPLPALAPYRQWYREANTAEEFVAAIRGALAENGEAAVARRNAAQAFGWNERAAVLLQLRQDLLDG